MLIANFRLKLVLFSALLLATLACGALTQATQEVGPSGIENPPVAGADPATPVTTVPRDYCSPGPQVHPIGNKIAESFAIPYQDVIDLYCAGHEFEEVLLALETSELSGVTVEDILQMREEDLNWEVIWKKLGLTNE